MEEEKCKKKEEEEYPEVILMDDSPVPNTSANGDNTDALQEQVVEKAAHKGPKRRGASKNLPALSNYYK